MSVCVCVCLFKTRGGQLNALVLIKGQRWTTAVNYLDYLLFVLVCSHSLSMDGLAAPPRTVHALSSLSPLFVLFLPALVFDIKNTVHAPLSVRACVRACVLKRTASQREANNSTRLHNVEWT